MLTEFVTVLLKMEYKKAYKWRLIPSLGDSQAKRVENIKTQRNEKRREFLWSRRGGSGYLPESNSEELEIKKTTRAEMLRKWKEEKQKKAEEAKKKEKPAFKAGLVQRKVTGSPLLPQSRIHLKKTLTVKVINPKIEVNKVEKTESQLTRTRPREVQEVKTLRQERKQKEIMKIEDKLKNKFCKIDEGKMKKVNLKVFEVPESVSLLPCNKVTYPCSPKMLRRSKRLIKMKDCRNDIREEKSEEPHLEPQESVEIKENVEPEGPTTSEVTDPKVDDFVPIYYSPFVTIRSGKKSVRKSKRSLTIDVDEVIKKEEKEFQCRIFSFRKYIECESERLLNTCDKWRHICQEAEEEVPLDVEADIHCIIGKTKLLTSDKFMQFKGLIDKCEKGDPFIKVDDLQGFQDWVSLEVERIDEDFLKLEKRKRNNWVEETAVVQAEKVEKVKVVKKVVKKPMLRSNIRSHILAARKLLKEVNAEGGSVSDLTLQDVLKMATIKKQSLLNEVLTSETKKRPETRVKPPSAFRERRNSGLQIMIASQKNKLPTPKASPKEKNYEISFEEVYTPNKSILKKTPKTLNFSKSRVTFKKITEAVVGGSGLGEKYFEPLVDGECSPMRSVLGDLANLNLSPAGILTRSCSKRISASVQMSPNILLTNSFL